MAKLILDKKEYFELLKIKEIVERILSSAERKEFPKKNSFLKSFGILKDSLKENSLEYISKLRKKWR